jgi:uncharacterized protein YecE (DUF72 family)
VKLWVGCPVWAHKGWVGNFYPAGTGSGGYLGEYARRLNTVEGNTTFYAVPGPNTVHEWAAETPETFRFCFKVPRAISHAGKLVNHLAAVETFLEAVRPLGPRLGPMFLQLPPRYHPNLYSDLRAFLEAWPADMHLAVEVRHLRWFEPPFYDRLNELLAGLGMARVVIDTRPIRSLEGEQVLAGTVYERLLQARESKPDLPIMPSLTAAFIFLRYIGHPLLGSNRPYLDEWVNYLTALPDDVSEAYVFCHSPEVNTAPFICRQFYAQAASRLSLLPLPWDAFDPDRPQQPPLF